MQNADDKDPDRKDPIASTDDSPPRRRKKLRAGYLIVLGIGVVALLVLAEWLVNGAIMLSKAQ